MGKKSFQVVHSLFLPAAGACRETVWAPPVDVYQTRTGWLLKFDLAGVCPEEIGVNIAGQRVTVRGCRRDWFAEEGHRHYRLEIAYSCFERSVELPRNLDAARMTTEYRDGMLVVRIHMENDT